MDRSQGRPPPVLNLAFAVLRFLSRAGNSAAEQRLQDIVQSCSHVWADHCFNARAIASGGQLYSPFNANAGHSALNPTPCSTTRPNSSGYSPFPTPHSDTGRYHEDESRLLEPWEQVGGLDTIFDMQGDWGGRPNGGSRGDILELSQSHIAINRCRLYGLARD